MLPGWGSLETATSLHKFFELGAIVLFALLVVFELGAYVYGHRKEALADTKHQAEIATRDARADKAEQDLAKLREETRQRALTQDERAKLIEALRPFAGQKILMSSPMNDAEAHTYALQLEETLRAAGLVIVDHRVVGMYSKEPYGLSLNFSFAGAGEEKARDFRPEDVPSAFPPMLKALKAAGLDVEAGYASDVPHGTFAFRVGHKKRD